ncbi:MAG TPA: serine/threonine-protein kinase [Humisphaera sp.]
MPNPNQRVGEYVLQDRIAAGAFGEVWRARHHAWHDQEAAIKIPTDPQYIRNLQHEGRAVHGLQHANIVRAIGFDPYAETPYLAMEYIPGSSLRPLIAGRKLSVDDAVQVMRQVLAGLAHAHANNVVHRDVKPENILIHERAFRDGFKAPGVVKVTDFGLGKAATAPAESIAFSQQGDSAAAREIAGTLDYMPPEQRTGGDVDARADVYACGVVLYELLTGEKPAGTDLPSQLNPAVPKYLDEAFRRSYSRLERRYGSADEFAKALSSAGAPPLPPVIDAPPVSGRRGVPPVPPPPVGQRKSCPQCHGVVEPGDQFCMHCGVQMVENVRRCPTCGAFPSPEDTFCIFCGQGLTAEATRVR